jgi:hypothetical protein
MSLQRNEEGTPAGPSDEDVFTSFLGGCACRAIRYECSAQPLLSFNCHCLDCQRASGSAFASLLIVPAADFELQKGEPTYHSVTADSGYTFRRGFCAECGSPVLAREPHRPRIVLIQAGSLDDPSRHQPAVDIYTKRAQPWDYMNPELPKLPAMPPLPDDPLFKIEVASSPR